MLFLLAIACGPPSLGVDAPADDSATQQDDSAPADDTDIPESVGGPDDSDDDTSEPDDEHASDFLFEGDFIPEFNLRLSSASYNSLERDPDTWVEGTWVYDGEEYGPVGVRLKGENSFLPISQKASFKVKIDYYVDTLRFYGLKELTLNNMSNDYSMMHERLAYRLFREAGLPGSRANHAHLSLNGEGYGLMAFVETVDDEYLEYRFEYPDGSLWEIHDVDFYDEYVRSFSHEEGEDDRAVIQAIADAMELSAEEAIAAAEPYLDYDQFLDFLAAQIVVGQFDSYPFGNLGDDCHIYADPARDGRLIFFPHGIDESFYYPDRDFREVNGVLAKKCLRVESCAAALYNKIWEMQTISEQSGQLEYFDFVRDQIQPYVEAPEYKPYDLSTVAAYQDWMRMFIAEREAYMEVFIGARP